MERNPQIGKKGLLNRGNTCFLNTTIQCLNNVLPLREYILQDEYMKVLKIDKVKDEIRRKGIREFEVMKQFFLLIKMMWNTNENVMDPRLFHQSFQNIRSRFIGYEQHDMEEALILIMDSIHETLNYPIRIKISGEATNDEDRYMVESYQHLKTEYERNYSVIRKIFGGQFMNVIISNDESDRGTVLSRTYELFDRINLPIYGNTLYDSLQRYFHMEKLTDKYRDEQNGNRMVEVGRQIKMMMLPKYMTIVFKRFHNVDGRLQKNNSLVSFPLDNLDVSNYTSGYDRDQSLYKLCSIGCHIGGLQGGHYYAICRRNNEDKWYIYNDNEVSEYNIRSEIPILMSRVYLLIYEKKE
jgi:ubiquitin carboxyl-terminal hydrolase 8